MAELAQRKPIVMILIILTVVVIIFYLNPFQFFYSSDKKLSQFDSIKINQIQSDFNNNFYNIKRCETERLGDECSESEQANWELLVRYKEICDGNTLKEDSDYYQCREEDFYKKIADIEDLGTIENKGSIDSSNMPKATDFKTVDSVKLFGTNEEKYIEVMSRLNSLSNPPLKLQTGIANLNSYKIGEDNALDYIVKKSIEGGADPYLVVGLVSQESLGNYKAISSTGCAGLFQFCYNTAFKDDRFNSIFGTKGLLCKDKTYDECREDPRFDVVKAAEAGIKYINILSNSYNGDRELILTGYNAGNIANSCTQESLNEQLECIKEKTDLYYKDNGKKSSEVASYIQNINSFYVAMVDSSTTSVS